MLRICASFQLHLNLYNWSANFSFMFPLFKYEPNFFCPPPCLCTDTQPSARWLPGWRTTGLEEVLIQAPSLQHGVSLVVMSKWCLEPFFCLSLFFSLPHWEPLKSLNNKSPLLLASFCFFSLFFFSFPRIIERRINSKNVMGFKKQEKVWQWSSANSWTIGFGKGFRLQWQKSVDLENQMH